MMIYFKSIPRRVPKPLNTRKTWEGVYVDKDLIVEKREYLAHKASTDTTVKISVPKAPKSLSSQILKFGNQNRSYELEDRKMKKLDNYVLQMV